MPEEQPIMSLQAEMDRESDRRASGADREKPEAFEPKPDPEVAATEQAAADGEGAEAVEDLESTTEQRAAKIDLTEVADISDTPHPVAKIDDNKQDDRRNCGLPERLWPVKEIVAYENLHSVTGKMRDKLEYTSHERNMYDRYQNLVSRAAAKEHFVVALRMFNAKLPERPAQELNLNAMKVS